MYSDSRVSNLSLWIRVRFGDARHWPVNACNWIVLQQHYLLHWSLLQSCSIWKWFADVASSPCDTETKSFVPNVVLVSNDVSYIDRCYLRNNSVVALQPWFSELGGWSVPTAMESMGLRVSAVIGWEFMILSTSTSKVLNVSLVNCAG